MHLASRLETIGALVRAANASLDPAEVAQALVTHATEWLPLSAWYVIAAEPDGVLKLLGKQIPEAGLKSAVESFADVIVQTGQSAVRVTNYVDDRVAGLARQAKSVEASTLGWPLVANGTVVGALVGLDRGRARRLPRMPQACRLRSVMGTWFSNLIEACAPRRKRRRPSAARSRRLRNRSSSAP
jgi:hypothetical protein